MTNISRDDLLLILRYSLHLAKADDDVSSLEKNLIRLMVQKLDLSPEERRALSTTPLDPDKDHENLSDEEAKRLLIRTLCAISHSDGILHYSENQFINETNKQLGHPEELRPWEEWMRYEEEVIQTLKSL